MQTPFQITGENYAVFATTDSSLYQFEITGTVIPNALMISVPVSTSNVITAVHASFNEFDSDAVVPTDGTNGRGMIVTGGAPVMMGLNTQAAATGNLYVSVASTANVTVYLTGMCI